MMCAWQLAIGGRSNVRRKQKWTLAPNSFFHRGYADFINPLAPFQIQRQPFNTYEEEQSRNRYSLELLLNITPQHYQEEVENTGLFIDMDAANNFARGHYTMGKEIVDLCLDRIRKFADNCTGLQGFLVFYAVNWFWFWSWFSSVGAVLSTHSLLEHTDVSVLLDNEAIYGICRRSLDIERPTPILTVWFLKSVSVLHDLRFFARFEGAFECDVTEFQTNLVTIKKSIPN
ncbi:tubulin alpha chain [Tanacetum coccineum]